MRGERGERRGEKWLEARRMRRRRGGKRKEERSRTAYGQEEGKQRLYVEGRGDKRRRWNRVG